jgi:predicted esterase YcpF (UPF0227 family)
MHLWCLQLHGFTSLPLSPAAPETVLQLGALDNSQELLRYVRAESTPKNL